MHLYKGKFILLLLFIYLLPPEVFSQSYSDEIKIFREKYRQDFLGDERSPIKDPADLNYIDFFEADSTYKINTEFIKTENAIPFDLPTMNGKTKKYIEYGTLHFVLLGKKLSLKVYQNTALLDKPEYAHHLFLPFLDETNGNETYGGGRYIDLETTDIKGNHLILDFNKAYNPYCAFAGGYSCPKPPEENYLHLSIKAGEKKFRKGNH